MLLLALGLGLLLRVQLLPELLSLPVLAPHLVHSLLLRALILGRVLDDEGVELVPGVDVGHVAASLARQGDVPPLVHLNDGLGIAASVALDKLLDESLEDAREGPRVVGAIDEALAALRAELALGAELATKVLGRVGRRAPKGLRDVDHVDDVRLDAVPSALDPRLELGHFVPVERIVGVVCADVDGRHLLSSSSSNTLDGTTGLTPLFLSNLEALTSPHRGLSFSVAKAYTATIQAGARTSHARTPSTFARTSLPRTGNAHGAPWTVPALLLPSTQSRACLTKATAGSGQSQPKTLRGLLDKSLDRSPPPSFSRAPESLSVSPQLLSLSLPFLARLRFSRPPSLRRAAGLLGADGRERESRKSYLQRGGAG